jgi:hypothetical protein
VTALLPCPCCWAAAVASSTTSPDRVELEPVRSLDGRQATHLRYRVVHGNA